MGVFISFDQEDITYTNGETIRGSVVLFCKKETTLSRVSVTLSGESTCILRGGPGVLQRKNRETHRLVHELQDITPTSATHQGKKQTPFKLGFGYHSFPFTLNIPWFSQCKTCSSTDCHSYDLPPSMSEVVKDAEIQYKIDASVTVRNIFNETINSSTKIYVWPLDTRPTSMPRASPTRTWRGLLQSIAHAEASIAGVTDQSSTSNHRGGNPMHLPSTPDAVQISIEARFPQDYGLTCGSDISMSLGIKKRTDYQGTLHLQSFQTLLVGYTDIGGQFTEQSQVEFWMVQSVSNINLQISNAHDAVDSERYVHEELWEGKPLPMSVIPSFKSCNVERRYELEISMGLQCEAPRGRVKFVQLLLPVRIFSGILPGRDIDGEKSHENHTSSFDDPCQVNTLLPSNRSVLSGDTLVPGFGPPPTYVEAVSNAAGPRRRR
ncbi:hypothetical protein K504DRAFT_495768 [Pleomassaria siparia CBS 279.74]|uniref:Arrestin-like N-terminal domain-containing protein n=1 Tax=Pleomassaria siparia CBS 279.74 TaxID=1314801 RepID=A0A6G1JR62_9PLEO|nr:hypothetical protein K504DRAFT_495768 [Pleomassaria siparia CBS 279.74]